ncbi:MAG: hypothetical protein NTX73_17440 [Rhodobacterales bacterium]|nr:hypothetical protein [Rhodobacterales bacterium]
MLKPILAVGILALAAPVAAETTFSLPQGCTSYVTVQKYGCSVSHLFTCEVDPAGHQRRIDMDESGMTYMGVIDSETQWVESFHASTGETTRLSPGAADPASFTELLATGRDGMDFQTTSDMFGMNRYEGEDRLTGETVVIDGVTLKRTEFDMVVTDEAGNVIWTVTGNEYINPEWRTFLSGTRKYVTTTDEFEEDASPAAFIFPGEPGFLSSTPRFDCGVVVSQGTADLLAVTVSLERN